MSPPLSRRKVLTIGSVVSLGSLAGCQGLMSSESPNTSDESNPDEKNDSLGLGYSESRSPFPSEEEAHSGWVHIVSDGDSTDLTFDVRFCSAVGDVEPELTQSIADEYVLRFTVGAESSNQTPSSKTTEESLCSSVTRLVGGANVPSGWETLTIAVNNIEIQTIERTGTMPELRPLPDPVRPQ